MTREAKIGLLVALAFILVVGILLSDHVTSATREPAAPLTQIEDSIRGSTTTPGTAPQLQNPPRLPGQTQEPATSAYVHPQPQPQGDVIVGIGTPQGSQDPQNGGNPELAPMVEAGASDPWNMQPGGGNGGAVQPQAQTDPLAGNTGANAPQPLQNLVNQHGDQLQVVGPQGGGAAGAPGGSTQVAGVKEYTIQSGDSLSKIVARHLGRYTPANEALILGLNPKLKANKDRIIVGEKVLVPATASAAESLRAAGTSTASNSPASRPPQAPQSNRAAQKPQRDPNGATASRANPSGSRGASGSRTYVVKDGDTLWSIASKQLGSGARHEEILKLNAEKLSGPDELQVGMKLKLPA